MSELLQVLRLISNNIKSSLQQVMWLISSISQCNICLIHEKLINDLKINIYKNNNYNGSNNNNNNTKY